MIESAANAKFKRIQKLMKQARARKKEGVFVVEGWKMVRGRLCREIWYRNCSVMKKKNKH